MASRLWQAVTPEPQEDTTGAPPSTPTAGSVPRSSAAGRGELPAQLVDRQEPAPRVDVLAGGQAARPGDVAGAGIERARLAEVALVRARVEPDVGGVGRVVDRRDPLGRPGARRKPRRGWLRRSRLER